MKSLPLVSRHSVSPLISTRLQPGEEKLGRLKPLQRFPKPAIPLKCSLDFLHPAEAVTTQGSDRRRLGGSRRGKSERAFHTPAFGSPFSDHLALRKMHAAAPFGRSEPPRRRRSYGIVTAEDNARNNAKNRRFRATTDSMCSICGRPESAGNPPPAAVSHPRPRVPRWG